MIDERYLKGVVDRIVANYAPDRVLLFGSQAKNQADAGSDIDLLIVKPSSLSRPFRGKNVAALFANSPVKLDLLFYTPEELAEEEHDPLSFVSTILQSARVVYSR